MYGTILDAGRILGQTQTDSLISGPLAPGMSKTYTFKCTQFGTTWYHSHHSSQYGDGVFGGIIINGPATANYDVDLGTYLVNDFYYKTASQLSDIINSNLQNRKGPPPADTILINGTNKNANGGGSYGKVSMTAGKKYLLRIVNPSLDNMIRVSLDNHSFSVVTADLVPIHPYNTNWLLLGIGDSLMIYSLKTYWFLSGQRYDVIIHANQTVGNYWFRAENEAACNSANNFFGRSIFSYTGAAPADPTSTGTTRPSNCNDESPLVPWVINNVPSDTFTSQVKTLNVDLGPGVSSNGQNIVVWALNFTAIDVSWENPILSYVLSHNTSYPPSENLIELKNGGIVRNPCDASMFYKLTPYHSGLTGSSKKPLAATSILPTQCIFTATISMFWVLGLGGSATPPSALWTSITRPGEIPLCFQLVGGLWLLSQRTTRELGSCIVIL